MPERVHYHKGYGWVYHRKVGKLKIHGRRHSKRDYVKDRQRTAGHHLRRRQRKSYGHTGDYYGKKPTLDKWLDGLL